MMYGMYGMGGFGGLLILVVVAAGIFWLVRSGTFNRRGGASSGLAVLEERYAKGEVSREEYLQKKADLSG